MQSDWVKGITPINDEVVEWAQKTGEQLALKRLTPSTIRRFFGEMRRIQSNFKEYHSDVPLLKAKLAYDVGRKYDKRSKKGEGVYLFFEVLSPGISAVGDEELETQKENFDRFVKLSEALVAFHKLYYKGKDD